jgi:hypothetical protein
LIEPDRHESTGPCANSYQIFQLLEDELPKKYAIFWATNRDLDRLPKSQNCTFDSSHKSMDGILILSDFMEDCMKPLFSQRLLQMTVARRT